MIPRCVESVSGAPAFEVGLRSAAPNASRGLDRRLGLQRLLMAVGVAKPEVMRIGRYEVGERLGQGGMGSVYRARDPELQRDVAIKLLHREVTPTDTESIRKEAKALASLVHPNVVTVYDLGVTNGQLYVAMQYVKGTDLRRRLLGRNAPSWQEAVAMFIAAGRGLAAAHAAGVVHRDFKPENVLAGDDGRIMLADFGLARRADHDEEGSEIAGTYDYMAPEVRRGEPANARSDQYSFCASTWRMLDPTTEPGTASSRIAPLVQQCLRRGLAVVPTRRWPSMDVLLEALEQALHERPRDRQRALLLDRVEESWIEGVLRKALEGRQTLVPPVAAASDRIDSPWSGVVERSGGAGFEPSDLRGQLEAGHGSLLVLGGPGAGKTTALLLLADELLRAARVDRHAPAPVVLNLSSFAAYAGTLRAWVQDEIVAKYSLPRKTVQQWLADDELALLLDGLDEVHASRRGHCIAAINTFRSEHPTPIVVVCRTDDYVAAGQRLSFGAAVEILPLPEETMRSVLSAAPAGLLSDPASRTPLMLSLLREAGGGADESMDLDVLYRAYVDHSFARHRVGGAQRDAIAAGLRWIATAMDRSGTTELWIEQLGGPWFRFRWQRLLAQTIGLLLIVLVAMLGLTAVTLLVEGTTSGALLGVCCAAFAVIFNRGLSVKPVGRLRWSWRRAGRWLPLALLIGLGLGALYGLFYVLWVNVVFGAAMGLLCALSIGFEPALLESAVRPNQGILQSAYNAVVVGSISAVVGGGLLGYGILPLMLEDLPPESTLFALENPSFAVFAMGGAAAGLTIALLHGGTAVLLHAAMRAVVATTTPLPLRLVPFLTQATHLAFMRRVGGGHIFVHRTLQEYFAAAR